jgi:hypothetical protein
VSTRRPVPPYNGPLENTLASRISPCPKPPRWLSLLSRYVIHLVLSEVQQAARRAAVKDQDRPVTIQEVKANLTCQCETYLAQLAAVQQAVRTLDDENQILLARVDELERGDDAAKMLAEVAQESARRWQGGGFKP